MSSSSANAPTDNVSFEQVYEHGVAMLNQSLVSFNEEVNDLLSTGYCDQDKLSAAFKNVENVNTLIPFWDKHGDEILRQQYTHQDDEAGTMLKLQDLMDFSIQPALYGWKTGASNGGLDNEDIRAIDEQIVSAKLISQQLEKHRYKTLRTALGDGTSEDEMKDLALVLYGTTASQIDNATAAKSSQKWRDDAYAAMVEAAMSANEDLEDKEAKEKLETTFDRYCNGNVHWATFGKYEQGIQNGSIVDQIKNSEPGAYASWDNFTRFMTEIWNDTVSDLIEDMEASDQDVRTASLFSRHFGAISDALEEDEKRLVEQEKAKK